MEEYNRFFYHSFLEKCDFITESASEAGYTTNTKHKEVFL